MGVSIKEVMDGNRRIATRLEKNLQDLIAYSEIVKDDIKLFREAVRESTGRISHQLSSDSQEYTTLLELLGNKEKFEKFDKHLKLYMTRYEEEKTD